MEYEKISVKGKEIILLGTAHISQKSVEQVEQAIEEEKPDVVGVELDIKRYSQLKQGKKWVNTNIGKVIGSGQAYLFLLTLLLQNLQRSLGQKIGAKPGMEMMQAIKIAEEKEIPVQLLDRDVNVTLKRAMQKMTIFEKLKLGYSMIEGFFSDKKIEITRESIEKLKEKNTMTELMNQLSKQMPSVKSVLVDERDMYIANSISKSPGKKVLAVVGAGHVDGIKKYLGEEIDLKKISKIEKGFNWGKLISYSIPLLFVLLIGSIFFTKGTDLTTTAIMYWILINGTLAAGGVIAARGHPLTIISAFLASPITSLHPFLASGWVAGLVEAKIKNPKVKDFENLRALNTYKDFTDNQVTKILLVVAFANLGSTIGTLIAFPLIGSLLA